jgi:hypothetical protein
MRELPAAMSAVSPGLVKRSRIFTEDHETRICTSGGASPTNR